MSEHTCHAEGCDVEVPPRMFMCKPHWFSLPQPVRAAIWREYRAGQERDKRPSDRYMAVQRWAVALVAFKPNNEEAARAAAHYIVQAMKWRGRAIEKGAGDPLAGIAPDAPTLTALAPKLAAPLSVPCPTCHAAPAARCTNYAGKGCAPHAARVKASTPAAPSPTPPQALPAQLTLGGIR